MGAYDAGRIINLRLAHSQCIGGMVQGIAIRIILSAASMKLQRTYGLDIEAATE